MKKIKEKVKERKTKKKTIEKKKILFSEHDGFLPIVKQLDLDKYDIFTTMPRFAQVVNDIDIKATAISIDQKDTKLLFKHCARVLNTDVLPISKNGHNDSEVKYLQENIQSFSYPRISNAISLVMAIDRLQPDLIIVHNDVLATTRSAALWGKAHDVPCLHLPHSVYIDTPEERGKPGTDIHDIVTASHIVVGGKYQRDWYETRGISSDNVFEAGLPQFSRMLDFPLSVKRCKKLLKFNQEQPVVMYASSWRQDTNLLGCHDGVEQSYMVFLKAVKEMSNIQVLVKIHPHAGKENLQWHIKQADEIGVNCAVTARHLRPALKASDLVFAYGPSNLLLEASFVPTRLMSTHGYKDDVVTNVGNEPEVADMVEGIQDSLAKPIPKRDLLNFQYKYCGLIDGKSNQRIAKIIDELC